MPPPQVASEIVSSPGGEYPSPLGPNSDRLLDSGVLTPDVETDEEDNSNAEGVPIPRPARNRRLSTYESIDGSMDLESDRIGGSARQSNGVRSVV